MNPGLAQRSCYTDLAVLPRPPQLANVDVDPDTGSFFINSQTVNCADLNPNTSITQQSFKPIADVPAYLIRGPDDCTALIGGTVCLTVTYGGYPVPSIKWLRAVSFLFILTFLLLIVHRIKRIIMLSNYLESIVFAQTTTQTAIFPSYGVFMNMLAENSWILVNMIILHAFSKTVVLQRTFFFD